MRFLGLVESEEYEYIPEASKIKQVCVYCKTETIGSTVCFKCEGNAKRRSFLDRHNTLNVQVPIKKLIIPEYSEFCDDEKNLLGFQSARIALYLKTHFRFKTDKKTKILYYGDENNQVWSREGEIFVWDFASKVLGDYYKKQHVINIIDCLKGNTLTDIEFSPKIACGNGLLDVETLQLTPFNLDEMPFYKV